MYDKPRIPLKVFLAAQWNVTTTST